MERNMRKTPVLLSATLGVALALVLTGCPKQPEVGETQPAGPAVASSGRMPPPGSSTRETRVAAPPAPRESTATPAVPPHAAAGATGAPGGTTASPLKDVFFAYDRALLTDDAKRILNEDVGWLKANSQVQIAVEGHCDERGTAEYNLALGERRAKAVRDYLAAAGVDGSRIRTISYGKERPFAPGHDESAWRWNRRAHVVVAR